MTDQPVILYVEDDPKSRRIMEFMLRNKLKLQHVTLFEDSEQFIENAAVLQPRPDIIFLDIFVQPHDGFAMLAMLREHPDFAHIPVVAVTASVMNDEILRLQEAGFDGCLAKPIDTDTFPDDLSAILQGKKIWHIRD